MSADLDHIVAKCRAARTGSWRVLSTGEKLAAAVVLNRPDWLAEMRYSILEAIDRIGPTWMVLLPAAARTLAEEDDHG